jgi:hypothetical protein
MHCQVRFILPEQSKIIGDASAQMESLLGAIRQASVKQVKKGGICAEVR